MGRFGAKSVKATTSPTIGVAALEAPASGMRRIKLCELIVGSDANPPADNVFRWEVNRSTAAATGTSVTPNPNDLADAACVALFKANLTAQGTDTSGAIPLTIPLNGRATFRWVPSPGGELVIPAVAAAGFHFNTPVCANTPSGVVSATFEEQ